MGKENRIDTSKLPPQASYMRPTSGEPVHIIFIYDRFARFDGEDHNYPNNYPPVTVIRCSNNADSKK